MGFIAQCWSARHRIVLLYKVTKSHRKPISKVRIIVFCSKSFCVHRNIRGELSRAKFPNPNTTFVKIHLT